DKENDGKDSNEDGKNNIDAKSGSPEPVDPVFFMDKNVTACDLPEIVVYKGIETIISSEEDRNGKVDDESELCNDPKTNQDVEESPREDFADAEGSSSSCNQDHLIVTREAKDSHEIEVATSENVPKESKTLGDILSWEDEPKPLEEQSQPQLQAIYISLDEPKEAEEEKLSSLPTTISQEPNKPFNDNQQPSLVVGDTLEDNKLISGGFGETSFSGAEAVSISGVSEKIVIGMAPPRKLMIISSEHENVMKSGAQESSSEQPRVTSSSGKSKNEEKRLGEEEEEKALSKYLSMDYPRIKQNPKSLVWGLSLPALRFTHCNMMAGLVEDYSGWVRRLVFKEDECRWYPTRGCHVKDNVSNKLFSNQNILGSEYCMNVNSYAGKYVRRICIRIQSYIYCFIFLLFLTAGFSDFTINIIVPSPPKFSSEIFVSPVSLTSSVSLSSTFSGRKETVLDLAKFVDKGVQVKLTGGRQVTGTLKGYDQLLNLVLDGALESVRDHDDPLKTTDQTRRLGLIVCRGTAVMLVSPTDGTEEIANPFNQPEAL
ncbi:unnamed protein product, partial [Brassica rapa]